MSASPTIERLPAVMARTGLSRSSIYAAMANGTFPPSIKLSVRAIGFLSVEVDRWISARAATRPQRGDTSATAPSVA